MRYWAPLLVGCAALLGGCAGSSGSNTKTTHHIAKPATAATHAVVHGWTGFGAPLTAFASRHQRSSGGPCKSGCYGSPETDAQGLLWEFTALDAAGPRDRVLGYNQAFPVDTPIRSAEAGVLALMPADTHQVGRLILVHSSTGSCAMWNLRSKTLGKWLGSRKIGDPKGQVGVSFSVVGAYDESAYRPTSITQAAVGIAPVTAAMGC